MLVDAKERSYNRAKAKTAIAEGATLQSRNDEAKMTTIQKIAIVLNSPHDWEVWIDMIQNRAKIAKIWKFIDPATKKEELPKLSRPALPLPQDINPAKTLISQLTSEEVDEPKARRDKHKDRNREYEKQQSTIESLYTLIHKTMS